MVNLTRIYTRTGDDGTTALGDMSRALKTDLRIEAFADVDEANSSIGVVIAMGDLDQDVKELLTRVQNDLFDVGADLATPVEKKSEYPQLRVLPSYVDELEKAIDHYNSFLEPLSSFILPGGSPGAALLHLARTIVRRAERSTWTAFTEHKIVMTETPARYLNRLSDLLFVLARYSNREQGDVLWVPGANR
jgi:cob(I)alamin adenosyltransferase